MTKSKTNAKRKAPKSHQPNYKLRRALIEAPRIVNERLNKACVILELTKGKYAE